MSTTASSLICGTLALHTGGVWDHEDALSNKTQGILLNIDVSRELLQGH